MTGADKAGYNIVYGPWETNIKTDLPPPTLNVEPHCWPHLRPCLSLPQAGQPGPGPLPLS